MNQQEFDLLTGNWGCQQFNDGCFITCLTNILLNLKAKHPTYTVKYDFKTISKICDYEPTTGYTLGSTIYNLNKHFEDEHLPFKFIEKSGNTVTMERLQAIINDGHHSYPIISLSLDFLKEQGIKCVDGFVDHAVVVIDYDVANRIVWFHDPYKPFASVNGFSGNFKNNLSYVKMLEYWNDALEPMTAYWIEYRKPRKGPLDAYV